MMRQSPRLWSVALFALHLGPAAASADTAIVPDSFATIQAALDGVSPGDTVLVRPGTYYENLQMRNRVTLVSSDGPEVTIIDGQRNGSVISCEFLDPGTRVSGFTLQRGHAVFGGGVYSYASAVIVEQNIIRDNTNYSTAYGAGVYTQACPREMVVRGNLIIENVGNIGGGICCNGGDRSTVVENTIWGNRANYASGLISYNESDILVRRNIIAENEGGKGLWVHSNSEATIECNDVWSNTPVNYHGEDMTGIAGNFSLDPVFCHPEVGDLRLAGDSPCLPGNHPDGAECGWIGGVEESCSALPGACCYDYDECTVAYESLCETFGGTFLGDGSLCADTSCPPTGACCRENGECFVAELRACEGVGGTFVLEGECLPNPCPNPEGACCLPGGSCEILFGTECAGALGVFLGGNTGCDPNPCDPSAVDELIFPTMLGLEICPNPSAIGEVELSLSLVGAGSVSLEIFDTSGRSVRRVPLGQYEPGRHKTRISPGVGPGTYFFRLADGGSTTTRRVVVLP